MAFAMPKSMTLTCRRVETSGAPGGDGLDGSCEPSPLKGCRIFSISPDREERKTWRRFGPNSDLDLAIGSKGAFRVLIKTTGKAAHSAYPEEGDSAITKLLDILQDVRGIEFPNDEFFGETTSNIGTINAGMKLNIIPANAEAGLLIRLTTPREPVQEIIEKAIDGRGELEILSFSLPVKMLEVEGFRQKVVRFTTDIPHLPNWGTPLLLGAGSILVAHTKDEFVLKKDLETAVGLYVNLVKKLLAADERG